jgi:hypothetical protein
MQCVGLKHLTFERKILRISENKAINGKDACPCMPVKHARDRRNILTIALTQKS